MKFNSLNFIGQPLLEQDLSCDSPPYVGKRKEGDAPFKGLSQSDWGLRQMDFEEILNDGSTNSLGASNKFVELTLY